MKKRSRIEESYTVKGFRQTRSTGDEEEWEEIESGRGWRTSSRPLNPEVIKEMPTTDTTFVERGFFDYLRKTASQILPTRRGNGNGH